MQPALISLLGILLGSAPQTRQPVIDVQVAAAATSVTRSPAVRASSSQPSVVSSAPSQHLIAVPPRQKKNSSAEKPLQKNAPAQLKDCAAERKVLKIWPRKGLSPRQKRRRRRRIFLGVLVTIVIMTFIYYWPRKRKQKQQGGKKVIQFHFSNNVIALVERPENQPEYFPALEKPLTLVTGVGAVSIVSRIDMEPLIIALKGEYAALEETLEAVECLPASPERCQIVADTQAALIDVKACLVGLGVSIS